MEIYLERGSHAGTGNQALQVVISPDCIGDACQVSENVLGTMLAPATTYRVWMVAVGHSTTSAESVRAEEAADADVSGASFLDKADLGTAVLNWHRNTLQYSSKPGCWQLSVATLLVTRWNWRVDQTMRVTLCDKCDELLQCQMKCTWSKSRRFLTLRLRNLLEASVL